MNGFASSQKDLLTG